jgi:hypothetical protein
MVIGVSDSGRLRPNHKAPYPEPAIERPTSAPTSRSALRARAGTAA